MTSVSHHFLFFAGILLGCIILPGICSAGTVTTITNVHPYLLFTSISQTPGYQYQAQSPWNTWQSEILTASNSYLSLNFSGNLGSYNRISYRGGYASYLGLSYQITKNPKYAKKGEEALLNMSVGSVAETADYGLALESYSLAYDWIQPTLDASSDLKIRDNLATLADKVYQATNSNGTQKNYIDFPDLGGHLYPALGIASAALSDYTNPNNLPLHSSPSDWYHAGTDYLFVNDKLHSLGTSLFSQEFDPTGTDLLAGYKDYTVNDLSEWYQVCNSSFGINLMSTYPVAEKAYTSETWESMPNEYSTNFVTYGNTLWDYQMGTVSLMSPQDKATVINHINLVSNDEKNSILPKSMDFNQIDTDLLYCVFGNYNSAPTTYPTATSHLDPTGVLQVIRANWSKTSDWLSFTTWNIAADSNRNMMHNDQQGFEYYSRGNLLLADAGEPKHILDTNYGTTEVDHNVIAIDNPRTSFPLSSWSDSTSAGLTKGTANNLITPASIGSMFQLPWMQLIQSSVTATKVTTGALTSTQTLSSPIKWQRTVLYPESDYFIIVDRFQGTETWGYRNIFRPSSLMVTPSTGTTNPNVGYDNVNLSVGSTSYNWQSLAYKKEINTGITTNSLTWQTTNPYGKTVLANLVTSPKSNVLIEKNDGRIGGYDQSSEVYTPVVYFEPANATSVFRVTALLANYPTETAKTGTEIVVNGTGHALDVHAPTYDDYIYTGTGAASFGMFGTNADTVYIRSSGAVLTDFTLLNGSSLTSSGSPVVSISSPVNYLTAKRAGNTLTFQIGGQGNNANILFNGISATSVTRDGISYSGWTNQNGSLLNISTDLGLHQFVINIGNALTVNPIGTVNATVSTPVSLVVNAAYSGKGTLTYTATNLPVNATFNGGTRTFTWIPCANQTGAHNVTFTVSDGSLSASAVANIIVGAPTVAQTPPAAGSVSMKSVYDGDLWSYEGTANSTFSTLISGTAAHIDHTTYANTVLKSVASSTNGTFYSLGATVWTFDTSSVPKGSTITSATLSLFLIQKGSGLGQTNYVIVPFSPGNSRNYRTSDWQKFGTSTLGSISTSSWVQGNYYNISLSPSVYQCERGRHNTCRITLLAPDEILFRDLGSRRNDVV